MGDVTPDQIANFDQALADAENNLDVLIDLWRTGDPDSPEHIRIAGLCVALGERPEWDRIAFVEILVAAIRRLDRAGQAATPDDDEPRSTVEDEDPFPELRGSYRRRLEARRSTMTATPDGPRRWALAEDATALDEWGARVGYVILITPNRQVAIDTVEDRGGELLRRRVIRSAWEPADATPAADGQDGDGR